ncbi:MAG: FAD-linked oxidase C-terminal domain-containing protein [Halofilum sp. (in: g-proteobacteria)]
MPRIPLGSDRMDFTALRREFAGDIRTDELNRRLVAQDASPYRVVPAALARPRDADDCAALVAFARDHGVSLIPRGGGTGLAGQCVGAGVVVDCSRYMRSVRSIDPDQRTVTVEPGLTVSQLNVAVAPYGLTFGPDPSTVNRATLGGVVGNNAWGPHAPVDGTTRDQVVAAEAVLADGSSATFGSADSALANADRARRERLAALVAEHGEAVWRALPPADAGLCSNSGYPLHALETAEGLNEARLLAGAEGTLALATALTLKLRPLRRERRVLCAHFARLADALGSVAMAREAGAGAIELLDAHLLELTRQHPEQAENRFWLRGTPEAVLLIEFADGREPGALATRLHGAGADVVPEVTGAEVERVWNLRRAGLGLLMGEPGPRKAVTGTEDTAVPLDRLVDYVAAADALAAREGTRFVHYGSVSLGLVHLRPFLDLNDPADQARYRRLLDAQALLVREHGGVLATKHGVGRLRAPWLEAMLGAPAHRAMRAVKSLYDPDGLFNPGKILDAPDPLTDLRGGGAEIAGGGFHWSQERGLADAAGRCNGAGACRKEASEGPMCPTFQATREERDGTRGRANLFQQALAAEDPEAALAGDDLHAALSLCLACKACQYDCPARVDMARLKSEALYRRHERRKMPLAARAAADFVPLSALAARAPRIANALGSLAPVQRALGLERAPPKLARESLAAWVSRYGGMAGGAPPARGAVILVQDPHTAWYEPGIGRAAIRVLEALGWRVHLTPPVSTGRAAISQGGLERARRELAEWTVWLESTCEAAGADAPILGLEPSELLTLRDEAPDLVPSDWRPRIEALAGRALLFEEWLVGEWETAAGAATLEAARNREPDLGAVALHVHCHARALVGTEPARKALAALPGASVDVIAAGCCGMAGAFGYGRETAATSRAVAELALAPAVRALPDATTVVAPGVSCRQQIRHMTGRTALHPAEVVARALGLPTG